ncbi:hypothetical protein TNCV_839361 [Trichonephila clavipes]|nr:hypothetical protein TNCV_839361 [Trichonephila clavipes]
MEERPFQKLPVQSMLMADLIKFISNVYFGTRKRKSSKHLTGKWVIGNAIRYCLASGQKDERCYRFVSKTEPPPTTPAAEDEDDSKAGNQVQADAPPRRANNARPAGQFRPQNGK